VTAVLAGLLTASAAGATTAAVERAAATPTAATPTATDSEQVPGRVAFSFTDPDIAESSGLVDTDRVVYTVNDSGAGPVLYEVDPATGDTIRTTTYSDDDVDDVEALAPGPDGTVWVADIGDNLRARADVSVYRVTPGRPERTEQFDLEFSDGSRDAEALLAHPVTGRLFVVSKTAFGGTVYAAPERLDADDTNVLEPFARVPGVVTGGEFTGAEVVLLRSYGTVRGFGFPGFELLGAAPLPAQRQGEALSVSPAGRVLGSSEGQFAEVLELDLPDGVTGEGATAGGSGGDGSAHDPVTGDSAPGDPTTRDPADADPPDGNLSEAPDPLAGQVTDGRFWLWTAVGSLTLGVAVIAAVLARQRRR
jgi:hypothetical protein